MLSVVTLAVVVPAVLGALFIGLGFLINIGRFTTPDPDPSEMEFAQPGDCVIEENDTWTAWGSCDDPAATKQIRSITQHSCIDAPGVDASWSTGLRKFCLGDKSVDPTTTINGIVAGECTNSDGNRRQECGTPGHRQVLAVLENAVALKQPSGADAGSQIIGGGAGAMCRSAGAGGADTVYSFSLVTVEDTTSGPKLPARTHHDRSLCLSEVR